MLMVAQQYVCLSLASFMRIILFRTSNSSIKESKGVKTASDLNSMLLVVVLPYIFMQKSNSIKCVYITIEGLEKALVLLGVRNQ